MMPPMLVWRYYDAPKQYQDMSPHGGDEDWIMFIPECLKDMYISWAEPGSSFGCCDVSEHEVSGGKILIGAHS